MPPGSGPPRNSKVTWRVLPEKVPDDQNGGKISVVEFDLVDGDLDTRGEYAVDLRDPDRVWTFSTTRFPGHDIELPIPTLRNLSNGLALAILHVHNSFPHHAVTWEEIIADQNGQSVIEADARKKLAFTVTSTEIIVSVLGSSKSYHYPLAGPKAYNDAASGA